MGKDKVKPCKTFIGDHWGRSWRCEHIYTDIDNDFIIDIWYIYLSNPIVCQVTLPPCLSFFSSHWNATIGWFPSWSAGRERKTSTSAISQCSFWPFLVLLRSTSWYIPDLIVHGLKKCIQYVSTVLMIICIYIYIYILYSINVYRYIHARWSHVYKLMTHGNIIIQGFLLQSG